jgi:protein-disulfide isomerase
MSLPALAVALLLASSPARIDTIQATDLQGKPVTVQTAGKITAVLFVSTNCPVSNDYNERMKALYKDYSGRGVSFVFLNANANEPAAEVAKHAHRAGFTFPVWKDQNNVEADRFQAEFTPHVFIVGRDSQLIYRGGIDDSRNPARITRNHLREALDAALAGKALPAAETKAFGCSIKRVSKSS